MRKDLKVASVTPLSSWENSAVAWWMTSSLINKGSNINFLYIAVTFFD